jgi:hypothetical protein
MNKSMRNSLNATDRSTFARWSICILIFYGSFAAVTILVLAVASLGTSNGDAIRVIADSGTAPIVAEHRAR